jgi:hypothetical protein
MRGGKSRSRRRCHTLYYRNGRMRRRSDGERRRGRAEGRSYREICIHATVADRNEEREMSAGCLMVVWDLWAHTRTAICSFPSSISSVRILPTLHYTPTSSSSYYNTSYSRPFLFLNGFVALSTFRISHAHPIFNWFSQGAQDARYSACFFRMG